MMEGLANFVLRISMLHISLEVDRPRIFGVKTQAVAKRESYQPHNCLLAGPVWTAPGQIITNYGPDYLTKSEGWGYVLISLEKRLRMARKKSNGRAPPLFSLEETPLPPKITPVAFIAEAQPPPLLLL
jgi:hypothetical protein